MSIELLVTKYNSNRVPICPDCGASQWIIGPMGGSCTNIECINCLAKYNYMYIMGYMERIQ